MIFLRATTSAMLVSFSVSLFACATPGPTPPLSNVRAVEPPQARVAVLMGPFYDRRQGTGGDITYIGTVRGGFGNPLERLHLEEGVSSFVSENIQKCFWHFGIATEPLPNEAAVFYDGHFTLENSMNGAQPQPIIVGLINSLQARHSFFGGDRYFEASIDLFAMNPATGVIFWQERLNNTSRNTKYTDGAGVVGPSQNIEPTRKWLSTLIQDGCLEISPALSRLAER